VVASSNQISYEGKTILVSPGGIIKNEGCTCHDCLKGGLSVSFLVIATDRIRKKTHVNIIKVWFCLAFADSEAICFIYWSISNKDFLLRLFGILVQTFKTIIPARWHTSL